MPKFYFTYGTSQTFPFQGGWTEVIAPNRQAAVGAFRAIHPDVTPNIINCSFIYSEEQFKNTCLNDGTGNMHLFCHERITIQAEPCDPTVPS